MKKKGRRREWCWRGAITVAILLILCFAYFQAHSLCRLRLLRVESNTDDRPVVVCRITNLSARRIYYPPEFRIERWNEEFSTWEPYDASTWNVAFPLSVRSLNPLERKTEEYPVFVYADPFASGRYRIVQQVSIGDFDTTAPGVTLFCEFAIVDT